MSTNTKLAEALPEHHVPIGLLGAHHHLLHAAWAYAEEYARKAMSKQAAIEFPKPRQQETPCPECHLQPGERCDICGALAAHDAEPAAQAVPAGWRLWVTESETESALNIEHACKGGMSFIVERGSMRAQLMQELAADLAAAPAPEASQPPELAGPTAPNLACKSVQARLAAQWGYVRAPAPEAAQAVPSEPLQAVWHWYSDSDGCWTLQGPTPSGGTAEGTRVRLYEKSEVDAMIAAATRAAPAPEAKPAAETFDEKCARNARVQSRYDELMREGKHGHYETMFRVVREEVERARAKEARNG